MFFLSSFSILKQHPADVQAQLVLPKSGNPQSSSLPFEPKQQKLSLGISKVRNRSSHLTPPKQGQAKRPSWVVQQNIPITSLLQLVLLGAVLPRAFVLITCATSRCRHEAHSAQCTDTRTWSGRKEIRDKRRKQQVLKL